MKLTDADTRLLAALGTDSLAPEALAARLDAPPSAVRERLAALASKGLVVAGGDGRHRRTESGRRVLATTAGARDERLDTTPAVERAIASFDCSPDLAEAIRHAYTFLRSRGRATAGGIVDAVYGERAAGYATDRAWWTDGVRDRLAALPGVVPPTGSDGAWRYAGPREATEPVPDGRWAVRRPPAERPRAADPTDFRGGSRRR